MTEIVKIIRKIISNILLVILVALVVLLVGMKFIGFTPYAVLSGSMVPELNIGDLVYVRECDDIKVGDYITFYINNEKNVVTHEVKEIDENNCYITKGIANETVDINPVEKNDVIGKVYFSIPYMGYISKAITTSPIKYYLLGVIIIYFSIEFLLVCIHK